MRPYVEDLARIVYGKNIYFEIIFKWYIKRIKEVIEEYIRVP
jgi:hypothetical protein